MPSWESLTFTEQTLMRRAIPGYVLAGIIEDYGMALRWAGAADAPPPRSYTRDEEQQLVPQFAAAALDLARRDLLNVHEASSVTSEPTGQPLGSGALQEVLTQPATWIWSPDRARSYRLSTPQHVRQRWFHDAYPTAETSGLPSWDELSVPQRMVLVCARESDGMLTGPWGIWEDPPADLEPAARYAWVEDQLAPLLPFVRDGWIEVRHFSDAFGSYTVIPYESLRSALVDPAIRYEGDEWGIGVGCVFTYTGLAIWRGGWSSVWGSRLTFD